MIAQRKQRDFTETEYFQLEALSALRHEYLAGEIVPMTGGSVNHAYIVMNLIFQLRLLLEEASFSVFATDLRLHIPQKKIYTYPDVMVVAGALQFAANGKDTLSNPLLIAEVLSPSTTSYDRGQKFEAYQTLPSFREYLLIEQSRYYIEHFIKQDGDRWTYTVYKDGDRSISLSHLPVEFTLKKIYHKVSFDEAIAEELPHCE